MQTDEELMLDYQAGNRAAFDILAKRHWNSVFSFIRRLVKDEVLAEDILSKTFLKLHTAAPSYQPTAKFSTFLFTIAYREAMSVLRSGRRQGSMTSLDAQQDEGTYGLQLTSSAPSPEEHLVQRQTMSKVDKALELLPALQRAAFLLFYRDNLSVQDIASALDLQPGSVRAYLTHARATLRGELLAAEGLTTDQNSPRR